MKKFFIVCLVMGLVFTAMETGYANEWKIYRDAKLGYQLRYPADGAVTQETQESVRGGFYLDPLQPVVDLTNNPKFTGMAVDAKSIVKVAFPYYYLIILTLNHAPQKISLPSAQPITIGQYHFYKQHSSDASMCHNSDYHTYFLPRGDRYYVFIFLIDTHCDEMAPSSKLRAKFDIKPEYFERILNTLEFNTPAKISSDKNI